MTWRMQLMAMVPGDDPCGRADAGHPSGGSALWRSARGGKKQAQDGMARFAWLVGEWEGPATVSAGGRSMTLTQRETVQWSAKHTLLLIQFTLTKKP